MLKQFGGLLTVEVLGELIDKLPGSAPVGVLRFSVGCPSEEDYGCCLPVACLVDDAESFRTVQRGPIPKHLIHGRASPRASRQKLALLRESPPESQRFPAIQYDTNVIHHDAEWSKASWARGEDLEMGIGGEHPRATGLGIAASVIGTVVTVGLVLAPHLEVHPLGVGGVVGLVAMAIAILVVLMLWWMRHQCIQRGSQARQHWDEIWIYVTGLLITGVIALALSSLVLTSRPAPSAVIFLVLPFGIVAIAVWIAFKQLADRLSSPSPDQQGRGKGRLLRIALSLVGGIAVVAVLAGQHPRFSPRPVRHNALPYTNPPHSGKPPSKVVPPGPGSSSTTTTTLVRTHTCGSVKSIKEEIEKAVPGAIGVNLYLAWYFQGTSILGCDFGSPYPDGAFTVLPVSGGSDGSDSLIANSTKGVVGFSDFGSDLLQNLPNSAKVMDRVRWGFGTAQMMVLNNSSCSLLDEYGSSTIWIVPQSVTILITSAAIQANGFPRIIAGPPKDTSGTFVIDFYGADSSPAGGSVVSEASIEYDASTGKASEGPSHAFDTDLCPEGITSLPGIARLLEISVDVASNNPNPDTWSPGWNLTSP